MLIFSALTTQTSSIKITDATRILANGRVSELCFMPIEWCVNQIDEHARTESSGKWGVGCVHSWPVDPGIDRDGRYRRVTGPPAKSPKQPLVRRSAESQAVADYATGAPSGLPHHSATAKQ